MFNQYDRRILNELISKLDDFICKCGFL